MLQPPDGAKYVPRPTSIASNGVEIIFPVIPRLAPTMDIWGQKTESFLVSTRVKI